MAKRPSKVPLITTKKMFYDLLQEALAQRGIETDEYKLHLMLLAERFQTYRYAQDILTNEGEYIIQLGDQKQTRTVVHPLSKVRDSQYAAIISGLKEYGLTPKSKADLQLVNNEASAAMEQIMNLLNSNDDNDEDGEQDG